ncbi:MAG: FG-GAP-like repeat-containing protein [Armatimonadota bacterium]
MKTLPDGARVCVNRKSVTRVWYDYLYIEEADRSCGIKVMYNTHYPPVELQPGNLVSFVGEMGTVGMERVIYATSEFNCDLDTLAKIPPVGVSTASILGWPIEPRQPEGPRVSGLIPVGISVRIAGRVSSSMQADDEGYYVYVDDGWGKKDGSDVGAPGVRIYTTALPQPGDFIVVSGILGYKMFDPDPGSPGDEFPIPVVRCNYEDEPYFPSYQPRPRSLGQISGFVRLVGEQPPGRDVRIYSQNGTLVVKGVTDSYKPFVLSGIPPRDPQSQPPLNGVAITASAPGYISNTLVAGAGDNNVIFELTPSELFLELDSDTDDIAICSSETARISALLRDCEGKGIAGRQIKLTTTKGVFVEAPEHPSWIVKTTNEHGVVSAILGAGSDNSGIAVVTATDEPDRRCSAEVRIALRGPQVTVSVSPKYLSYSGSVAVTANVTEGAQAVPFASVVFRTDHGVFQQSGTKEYATQADQDGIARANLVVSSPGTARILAVYSNACGHEILGWAVVGYKTPPWFPQGVQYSHPLVVDLDGDPDGKKEIVIVTSSGYLTALKASGTVYWSLVTHLPGNNTVSCAVLNNERSGRPVLFVPAESQQRLYAFCYDGTPLAGWPVGTNFRFIRAAAAIGDINLDGTLEIVAGDESCYVFSWNPTGDWRKSGTWDSSFLWRNLTHSSSTTIFNTTCALGDIKNDPIPPEYLDVVVGSNHTEALFAFPGNLWGDFVNNPVYLDGFPKSTGARVETSPAIGDIDGDGKNDLAVGSDDGRVYIFSSRLGTWKGYPTGGLVKSSPALADLDGDGSLDTVVIGSDSGRVFAFNYLGQAPPGWDGGIKLNPTGDYPVESSPVVADVTGDGKVEIVVGCSDGNLYAIYADGIDHKENGVATGPFAWVKCCVPQSEAAAQILTAPVVDDIDNDGKVEVLCASDKGVYIFHFDAYYDPNNFAQHPWPTFHANNHRNGCVTPTPPPVKASIVGIVTSAGQPVPDAKVYIWEQDGSPVMIPHSDPPVPRSYVLTVGTTNPNEYGKGAYCINQLEPNKVYKIKVEMPGVSQPVWVENIQVTTGQVVVDIDVP